MLDRYSHIRLDAKRQALEALAQGSMAQTTTQKAATHSRFRRKLLILMVGACGFEPQTPTVSTPSLLKSHSA